MTIPTHETPSKTLGRPRVTDRLTTARFAETVGVSQATVTKLRTGGRLPSVTLLYRMIIMFDLDPMTALTAYVRGRSVFSAWVRVTVFDDPRPHDLVVVADLDRTPSRADITAEIHSGLATATEEA